jgi:pyrroline-5-carboxylate reductase
VKSANSTEQLYARGVTPCKDNAEVASRSNVIFIAVKPYTAAIVLTEMRCAGALTADTLVISICAGVTLATLEEAAGPGIPVMRVMPNTPCLVGRVVGSSLPGVRLVTCHSIDDTDHTGTGCHQLMTVF